MPRSLYKVPKKNKVSTCLTVLTLFLLIGIVIIVSIKIHSDTDDVEHFFNGVAAPLIQDKPKDKNPKIKNNFRLTKDIKPYKYILKLWPNLENRTFEGTVKIYLELHNDVKTIHLHAKDLNIHSVSLRDVMNNIINIDSLILNEDFELLEINLYRTIKKAKYVLYITFTGRLDKGLVGFYASTLKKGGTMVASKFQPTYARQAFPCFDEPEFKATYDITLVKPTDYIALSNMNEISKTYDKETNTDIVNFATSVPMSTYLACFVICNFDYKETEIMTNGIGKTFTLRSFAQKNQTHKIDFAQDIGKRATEFYIKYYEVPFPLPKLDMIAIPDYVSGATEHWGLITYRETSFLVDENVASSKNKINVANTIAHELAHMWFGNLVTMKWWDEVWLNEGFASYMQVKALNALEPSWTMLDQFLVNTLHSVLITDAKVSSHPIVQTVDSPDQITAIFDAISYNKGASVLRMLENFIGEENFRKGVSDYLKKFQFGNTVTQDLLICLETYFKKDNPSLSLKYIMDTWTRQMGYPVLNVQKGVEDNTYVITQKQFLLDPKAVVKETSEFKYRWFVPVTYKTGNGAHENVLWFPDSVESVKITLNESDGWIKLNNNQVGYYRVNYPVEMWGALVEQLRTGSEKLTISDRAHLMNDAFALAEAGVLPYGVALELSTYLRREHQYVPWITAGDVFRKLANNLLNSAAYDDLMRFVQHLVKPQYDKQSWEKTSPAVIDGLSRAKLLSLAATHHLPEAEAKVRSLFLGWLNSRGSADAGQIETDLRDFVYYCGMKAASIEEWNKLWDVYLKEEDVQEQAKLRVALSAPRDPTILKKYLSLAWDEKNIRSQDYLGVISYVSSNPDGTGIVWDEVRSRWPQLVDRFTLNSRYLGNTIPAVTSTFNSETQLKQMEEFFQKYPEAGAGETARRRALENVRNNIIWANTHRPIVAEWLQNYLKTLN